MKLLAISPKVASQQITPSASKHGILAPDSHMTDPPDPDFGPAQAQAVLDEFGPRETRRILDDLEQKAADTLSGRLPTPPGLRDPADEQQVREMTAAMLRRRIRLIRACMEV